MCVCVYISPITVMSIDDNIPKFIFILLLIMNSISSVSNFSTFQTCDVPLLSLLVTKRSRYIQLSPSKNQPIFSYEFAIDLNPLPLPTDIPTTTTTNKQNLKNAALAICFSSSSDRNEAKIRRKLGTTIFGCWIIDVVIDICILICTISMFLFNNWCVIFSLGSTLQSPKIMRL